MPSVSHRGTRCFDSCSVMTCASSCQSVGSQLKSPGGRACGESSVTTRPKQAPSAPSIPGSPTVRTAKSSCFGNISIRIGPFGVNWYFFSYVLERPLRERPDELAHHRRFLRIELDDEIAVAHDLELVEAVHHHQEIVRRLVERIAL